MVLIRWARGLLAFPLQLAGRLLSMFYPPVGAELLALAWAVGRSPCTAVQLLTLRYQCDDPAEMIRYGLPWAQRWPSATLWSVVGMAAVTTREFELANRCLAEAQKCTPDPDGLVDLLDYFTRINDGEDKPLDFSEGSDLQVFLQRRDLSITLGRVLAEERIWRAVFRRDLAATERLCTHALEVEEFAPARMAMGIVETLRGRHERARVHFQRANFTGPEAAKQRMGCQAFVDIMLGDDEVVRERVSQLDASAPDRARVVRRIVKAVRPGIVLPPEPAVVDTTSDEVALPPLPIELPPPLPSQTEGRP